MGSAKSPRSCGRATTRGIREFTTELWEGYYPWDPRIHHRVVGGLLPVGSMKSPAVVDVSYERGMDCYDPL